MSRIKDVVLGIVISFVFVASYYFLMPVLPLHMERIGGSPFEIGSVMGIFFFVSLFVRPISGQLVDRYGSKKLMFMCLILFSFTPILYIFATRLWVIGFLQILYGIIIAGFTISTMTYIAEATPTELMAQAIGYHSIAFMMAKNIGPALGLKVWGSYGLLGAVIGSAFLALVGGISILLLSDPEKEKTGVSPEGLRELFKVAGMKRVLYPAITLLTGMIAFGGINVNISLYADFLGIEDISAFFLVTTVVVILVRVSMGKATMILLPTKIIISLAFMTVSLLYLSSAQSLNNLILVAVFYGIGFGILFPTLTFLVVTGTPKIYRGKAVGIYTASADLATSLGSVFFGVSQFIGFTSMYRLMALVPLLGIVFFKFICVERLKRFDELKELLGENKRG